MRLDETCSKLIAVALPFRRSRDLLGEWRLDYTDARDVLSLALFPGAIAELGEIFQNIEPGLSMDEFKAANVVELLPRGSAILNGLGMRSAVRYRVLAACNVQNETRLSLVFMGLSAQLEGDTPFGFQPPPLEASLPQELIERLQELAAERVYLDTTYLDKDLRVIRGPTQEIYVLSKVL
uniref:Plastid lipid-associated protein/fibrillin conserved domain-containing protein n=1 Tax=Chrysotila carterae TaxID=13221 RepID=A0A7S4FAD9_CHRCT